MDKDTKYEDNQLSQRAINLNGFEENLVQSILGTVMTNIENVTFPQFTVALGDFATAAPILENDKYVIYTAAKGLTPSAKITFDIASSNDMSLQNKCTFNVTDIVLRDGDNTTASKINVVKEKPSEGKEVTCTSANDSFFNDFDLSDSVRSFIYSINRDNGIKLNINDIKSTFVDAPNGKKDYCAVEIINKRCDEIAYIGATEDAAYYYQDRNSDDPLQAVTLKTATDIDTSYGPVKKIDFLCDSTPVRFGYGMLKLFGDSLDVSVQSTSNRCNINAKYGSCDTNKIVFTVSADNLNSLPLPFPRTAVSSLAQIPLMIGDGNGSCRNDTCPNHPFILDDFLNQTGNFYITPLCMQTIEEGRTYGSGDWYLYSLLHNVKV